MKVRSELLRDWRVILLIIMDLSALLVIFPRITISTTEFSVSDINSSQIVLRVLRSEPSYQNVTHLFSTYDDGLWHHGYAFQLLVPREHDSLQSELRAKLSGMVPRGMVPDVSVNATQANLNVTVTDRDCVLAFLEAGLEAKVLWVQSMEDSISIVLGKRLHRDEGEARKILTQLLGTAARIVPESFRMPKGLKTNLKLGIDFLGGFYYNIRPVGITFTARISAANVTPMLFSEFLYTRARLEKSDGSVLTISIDNPANFSAILMEAALNDFYATYSSVERISVSFGNQTSTIVVNATNYGALVAVLNKTLTGRYDVVQGDEGSGLFEVEGRGSEATREQIEANLSRYARVTAYDSRVSTKTIDEVTQMIESRANFLGVSDLRTKRAGNEYIMIESPERIAGGSSILEPLDFEARLWVSKTETIRAFGAEDVSRVDHYYYVTEIGGWAVPLTLRTKAAEDLRTKALIYGAIDADDSVRSEHKLGMFFNGVEVYNASFSKELAENMRQSVVVSFLAITGGPRENADARKRAEDLYINLEASFPTKLRTAGEGQIPPILGKGFGRQIVGGAIVAMLGVYLVVYLRYRRPKLVLAVLLVSLSEVLILLGFAVVIGWYLDLASVAAIIAVIGTGVDHQIVITDEALYAGEGRRRLVISTRISRAFFIIFTAAATTIVAMSPLAYVGLGRLRGFAIVTIVGVLVGVLVTRPAYGRIVRRVIGG